MPAPLNEIKNELAEDTITRGNGVNQRIRELLARDDSTYVQVGRSEMLLSDPSLPVRETIRWWKHRLDEMVED